MRTCALSRPRWELKLWVQSKYGAARDRQEQLAAMTLASHFDTYLMCCRSVGPAGSDLGKPFRC
ncbi:MAG: hypothetical protein MKZ95_00035, partial [Pirellulales bacterium]|nr:hypothetical protein [Pirellulales bacterium]